MKRFMGFVLAICLCFAMIPFGAAGAGNSDTEFEAILEKLCEDWSIAKEDVIAGYMNLVTGEEHYWQGDKWEYCASMYKVPLNMLVAEKMVKGELDWEKKYPTIPYKEVLEQTLLYSSNEWAKFEWGACGSYSDFKKGIMPYMGIKESDLYERYNIDNKFTARQFITCLKTLYENPERFPGVLDTMKEAEPERFFRFTEKRYTIAQKYGYVVESNGYYVNACGIAFTEEPIALVMFTRNAFYPDNTLSAYCTAMCDYTNDHMEKEAPEKQ